MLLLFAVLILPNVFIVSGLMRSVDDISINDLGGYSENPKFRVLDINIPQENPLWVLRLGSNEFDHLKMRVANDVEEEDFFEVVEPLIERAEQRQSSSRRRNQGKQSAEVIDDYNNITENKNLKMEIMKIVNKFALSTNDEPDSYLTESDDDNVSSLALYFKGAYTSLIVKLGVNQWHYFITPSPFPEWFHEDFQEDNIIYNDEETYVNVPDYLQTEFYKVLLHTVQKLLGFPV